MISAAAVEVLFVMVVAGLGAATGWFLRSGMMPRKSGGGGREIRHAREVMGRLQDLAVHVAADVGKHSSRVEEINEELLSSGANEAETVMSAVDRLLEANDRMQQQLTSADEKLREQARQIESHAAEARTDALTGLANRRAFDDEMDRRFAEFRRHGRTFSVTMIDVDHFKKFNDSYGHQAGDAVLAGLGGVLRGNSRQTDLVARYGGEEFALVLPGASAADSGLAADRLRGVVESTPFGFQGTQLHVTVSMGVAEALSGDDVPELIRRADSALYASKEAGRNCVLLHDGEEIRPVGVGQDSSGTDTRVEDAGVEGPHERITATAGAESPDASTRSAGTELAAAAEDGPEEEIEPSDRAVFNASLVRRLRQCKQGEAAPAVLLVRVDRYREIICEHGREAGEQALRVALRFLHDAIHESDLLARYDVATFAILLPGAQLAPTVGMAERLRESIAGCTTALRGKNLSFTVSLSAAAPMNDDDAAALLRRAEEALDAACKSGGNCSYFHNGQWSEIAQATTQGSAV